MKNPLLILVRPNVVIQILVVLEEKLSCGHVSCRFAGIQRVLDVCNPRQLYHESR